MILAHRGYWKRKEEQNSISSFKKALENNFGIETDIRDYNGKLIISHDIPKYPNISLEELLELAQSINPNVMLALNIKSDGQLNLIEKAIKSFSKEKFFCFDMSLPETRKFSQSNTPYFIRQSEYEHQLSFLKESKGVWIDCFESIWFSKKDIFKVLDMGKSVCVVSPELHNRDRNELWLDLKSWNLPWKDNKIFICTDYPLEAWEYFCDK